MITNQQLDEIEEVTKAVIPGFWKVSPEDYCQYISKVTPEIILEFCKEVRQFRYLQQNNKKNIENNSSI